MGSKEKKFKEPKFKEGKAFEFYHYSDLFEAENRSADIGFPIFCCGWGTDGSAFIAGGGGTKGTGVRSAIVSCRLIDGDAVEKDSLSEALIDPIELSTSQVSIPAQPQLQAVGEVTTDDEIVFSIRQHHEGSVSSLACSVGPGTVIFDVKGFGALATSSLPPFQSPNPPAITNSDTSTALIPAVQHPQPIIGLRTPFKSPLLSQLRSPSSSLQSVLKQFTQHGKRKLSTRMRFRTDFAPRDSFQALSLTSPCGRMLISGGQDGVIRAFLLDDADLEFTAVFPPLPGQDVHATPLKDGNSHAKSLLSVPYVSPKCLPVGRHNECILSMSINSTGTHLTSVSESSSDGLKIWALPTVEELDEQGIRIPVDYINPSTGKCGDCVGAPSGKFHAGQDIDPSLINPNTSFGASQVNVHKVKPVVILAVDKGLEFKQMSFWSPPILDPKTLPSGSGPLHTTLYDEVGDDSDGYDYDTSIDFSPEVARVNTLPDRRPPQDILLSLCNVRRTGPSYLCKWLIPHAAYHNSYSKQMLSPSTVDMKQLDKVDKQVTPLLASRTVVDSESTASQLLISPNGHYIAVSTTHLHVFTGPDHPYVRSLHLRALKQPCSKMLAALPPLSLVTQRQRCFDLPCTGVAFDPSSRLLMAVSASRAVMFLSTKCVKQSSALSKICSKVGSAICCCNVWKRCCKSQWNLVLLNILLIVFVAMLVQHYAQIIHQVEEEQYFH